MQEYLYHASTIHQLKFELLMSLEITLIYLFINLFTGEEYLHVRNGGGLSLLAAIVLFLSLLTTWPWSGGHLVFWQPSSSSSRSSPRGPEAAAILFSDSHHPLPLAPHHVALKRRPSCFLAAIILFLSLLTSWPWSGGHLVFWQPSSSSSRSSPRGPESAAILFSGSHHTLPLAPHHLALKRRPSCFPILTTWPSGGIPYPDRVTIQHKMAAFMQEIPFSSLRHLDHLMTKRTSGRHFPHPDVVILRHHVLVSHRDNASAKQQPYCSSSRQFPGEGASSSSSWLFFGVAAAILFLILTIFRRCRSHLVPHPDNFSAKRHPSCSSSRRWAAAILYLIEHNALAKQQPYCSSSRQFFCEAAAILLSTWPFLGEVAAILFLILTISRRSSSHLAPHPDNFLTK